MRTLRWRILGGLGAAVAAVAVAVAAIAGLVDFVEIGAVGWNRPLLSGPEKGVVWCEDSLC